LSVKAICKRATVSQFEGGPQVLFERYSRLNGIWFVFSMEDIEDFRKLSLRELFQRFVKSDDLPNLKITFARILANKAT
jgi:hypothetical protein